MLTQEQRYRYSNYASYFLMAGFLLLVLTHGLLSALLSGLLVYSLVHMMVPFLERKISSSRARLTAVAAIGAITVALLTAAVWGAIVFFRSDAGNMQSLLQRMADIIDASRDQVPVMLRNYLPSSAADLSAMAAQWLRDHAVEAKSLGAQAGRVAAHVLIGMIVGAMAALHQAMPDNDNAPLSNALSRRLTYLHGAFHNVVFAQVRISAINTSITAIFLLVALPLAGVKLPLIKTMIAVTFFAGLLPVIGNIISNTVLVVVSLSHSLSIAVIALLFLITIHKLEYFLNARIIGAKIDSHVWELLAAMLIAETLFGVPGLIAAPVFYAYVKNELVASRLI
ncbi:MAG TPA: AI-2E family transporter [Burkholderiaceae bacterium]